MSKNKLPRLSRAARRKQLAELRAREAAGEGGIISLQAAGIDDSLAMEAWQRADVWARSPEGTPYGATAEDRVR